MSIILDALRRGRSRQTPVPNPNAAQTDAVLQTLGYGRLSPTTPFNRVKRVLGLFALAVIAAILLWATVIWITRMYLTPTPEPDVAAVSNNAATPAPPTLPQVTPPPAQTTVAPPMFAPGTSATVVPTPPQVVPPASAPTGASTSAGTA